MDVDEVVSLPNAAGTLVSGAPVGEWGGAVAPEGPEAADFVVRGLTMRVPNPKFVGVREQFEALRRRARVERRGIDQAREWILESEITPTYGLVNDPSLRRSLDVISREVREVLEAATYVRKPPEIVDERNQHYIKLFATALQGDIGVVARNARIDALRNTVLDEERAKLGDPPQDLDAYDLVETRVDNVIDVVTQRFESALTTTDFSEMPVTREELRETFFKHLKALVLQRRRAEAQVDALPFEADADDVRDMRERYYAECVEATVVTSMRDRWLTQFFIDKVPAYVEELDGAVNVQERAKLIVYVNMLVAGRAENGVPVLPHVARREASIFSDAEVAERYIDAVLATIRMQAIIDGLGVRPAAISDQDIAYMRSLQAQQVYAVNHTEEALQTERVRVLMEANVVKNNAEAQAVRLEHELRKIDETVEIPLVVERNDDETRPFELTARVELANPGANNNNNQVLVEAPDIVYTYEWLFRPGGSHSVAEEASGVVAIATPASQNTVVRVDGFKNGDAAGTYRVRVTRIRTDAADGSITRTVLYSNEATLRIWATCVRCANGAKFYIGRGTSRRFGECEWRSKPINSALLTYRNHADFKPFIALIGSPAGGGAGSGNGYNARAELDDSIMHNDTLIVDDAGLLNLSVVGHETLRQRFFTYEAIVKNIAQRMRSAYTQRYGPYAANVLFTLFTGRISALRDSNAEFVGALYTLLDPPSASAVTAAAQALLGAPAEQAEGVAKFRAEVLNQPWLTSELNVALDARMGLSEENVGAAADATAMAQRLQDVPVAAVLTAALTRPSPLDGVVTHSERRFLGELAGRFGTFGDMYRASATNADAIGQDERERFTKTGVPLFVVGATPAKAFYKNGDFASTKLTVSSIRFEAQRVANAHLAAMTALDVRTSEVWSDRGVRVVYSRGLDAYNMFIDRVGELRLAERIAAASTRTNMETRARKFVNDAYSDERDLVKYDLEISAALSKPLGVSTSLWLTLGDVAQRNGVAATAQMARRIARVGGLEKALGVRDWRGIHSASDDQPTPYDIQFAQPAAAADKASTIRVVRGSERLFSGYDYNSIHRRIQQLVYEHNVAPNAESGARIERLALYFNVLTQFAPKLATGGIVTVDDIEEMFRKV